MKKKHVRSFFNKGLAKDPPPNCDGSHGSCFTSAHTMDKLLDAMDPEMGKESWTNRVVHHEGYGDIEFHFRDLEKVIRHIFKQPAHESYMVYKPIKEWDSPDRGYRVISEMHTANWWWKVHVRCFLPPMFI